MSVLRPNASARRQHRRAPRSLTAALVELLRAHRPPTTTADDHVWICLSPATAAAIARIAARRAGSMRSYRDHPAHEATRRPLRVPQAMAAVWCEDAWQAAGEGLIGISDALLLAAQLDAPDAA
ncbi:MAG: hypothetical protein ACLGI5_16420 [Thermoleophilia bacterium]